MHAAAYPINVASRAHASTRRLRAPRRVSPAARAVRVRASGTSDDASADDALTLQWMALNYRPWIKSEEDARKCLTHLREKENREFDLAKAKDVLDSIKADHVKQYQQRIPVRAPQTLPRLFAHPRAVQREAVTETPRDGRMSADFASDTHASCDVRIVR